MVLVAGVSACSTNPITGRASSSPGLGEHGDQRLGPGLHPDDGRPRQEEADRAGRLGARAAKCATSPTAWSRRRCKLRPDSAGWKWEVQVINDPKTVNAFCMAGGKMAIYTGMWDKLKATDDEIAQVMGHEIGARARRPHARAHVDRDGPRRSPAAAARSPSAAAMTRGQALTGAQLAAVLAIQLPNSRESESEADQIGIELAARAGYDPKAAVTLWEKMAKLGGGPPEFLSTHPSPSPSPQHRRRSRRARRQGRSRSTKRPRAGQAGRGRQAHHLPAQVTRCRALRHAVAPHRASRSSSQAAPRSAATTPSSARAQPGCERQPRQRDHAASRRTTSAGKDLLYYFELGMLSARRATTRARRRGRRRSAHRGGQRQSARRACVRERVELPAERQDARLRGARLRAVMLLTYMALNHLAGALRQRAHRDQADARVRGADRARAKQLAEVEAEARSAARAQRSRS